jgi:hypothetical protein
MDEATREAIYAAMEEHFSDKELLHERLERFGADVQFALDHSEEWRRLHPDHWIAVYQRELVAVEQDEKSLYAAAKRKSIPLADAFVNFLPRVKPILML